MRSRAWTALSARLHGLALIFQACYAPQATTGMGSQASGLRRMPTCVDWPYFILCQVPQRASYVPQATTGMGSPDSGLRCMPPCLDWSLFFIRLRIDWSPGKVASYAPQATTEMGAPAPGTDFVFHSAESRCNKKGRADYTAAIGELIFYSRFHLDIAVI